MKYFAHILQRPMAFIFLLLFIGGCLVLLITIEKTTNLNTVDEIVDNQSEVLPEDNSGDLAESTESPDDIGTLEDEVLSEIAIGGPDVSEPYEPVRGDSGDEDAPYIVVSEEVQDPSLCTAQEKYDEIRQVCYFTCDTPQQCDQKEQSINELLAQIESVYDDFSGAFVEMPTEEEKLKTLAVYNIEGGEWIENETGNDLEKYKDIWAIFAAISPDEVSDQYMEKYTVYENKKSDTAAFVERIKPEENMWELSVNIAAIDEQSRTENIFLMTHEFAHILTLNESQVDTQAEESACLGYFTEEGCATQESYLGLFFDRFWSQVDILEMKNNQDESQNTIFEEAPDEFHNRYAATNPAEDIAESFAAFVFKAKPVAQTPEGLTVADQKINFFYDFPELVQIRTDIRSNVNIERKFERR